MWSNERQIIVDKFAEVLQRMLGTGSIEGNLHMWISSRLKNKVPRKGQVHKVRVHGRSLLREGGASLRL